MHFTERLHNFYKKLIEDHYFVIIDKFDRMMGFAICKKKFKILDKKDKPIPIICYRYKRGWKVKFPTEKKYNRALKELCIRDPEVAGKVVTSRLKKIIHSHHN